MADDLPLWIVIIVIIVIVIGSYIIERIRGRNPYASHRRRHSGPDGGDAGGSPCHDYDGSDGSDSGDGGGD